MNNSKNSLSSKIEIQREKPFVKRSKSEPQAINNILKKVLGRHDLAAKLDNYQFVLRWKQIVGDKIAAQTRPESIERGILKVRVSNSAWAQELSFHREAIIKRIKNEVPSAKDVRDLVFLVGR